jgi:hypothetical protein
MLQAAAGPLILGALLLAGPAASPAFARGIHSIVEAGSGKAWDGNVAQGERLRISINAHGIDFAKSVRSSSASIEVRLAGKKTGIENLVGGAPMGQITIELHATPNAPLARHTITVVVGPNPFYDLLKDSEEPFPARVAPRGTTPDPVVSVVASGRPSRALADVPGAENALFAPDGRLFVTGTESAYEITRDAEGRLQKLDLYEGKCNFTGLARHGTTLYAACKKDALAVPVLLAARLTDRPRFAAIHQLTGMQLPNGMDFDAQGHLYIANTDVLHGRIVRVKFREGQPLAVAERTDWAVDHVGPANGLKVSGSSLYITAGGAVKRIPIRPDGSSGPVATLKDFPLHILDDLSVLGHHLVVTDYTGGRVLVLNRDGALAAERGGFVSPSSATLVPVGSRFPAGSLLITEKGHLIGALCNAGCALTLLRP